MKKIILIVVIFCLSIEAKEQIVPNNYAWPLPSYKNAREMINAGQYSKAVFYINKTIDPPFPYGFEATNGFKIGFFYYKLLAEALDKNGRTWDNDVCFRSHTWHIYQLLNEPFNRPHEGDFGINSYNACLHALAYVPEKPKTKFAKKELAELYYWLGRANRNIGWNYDAENCFLYAKQLCPSNETMITKYCDELASLYFEQGDFTRAEEMLNYAMENTIQPSRDIFAAYAEVLFNNGKNEQAFDVLLDALSMYQLDAKRQENDPLMRAFKDRICLADEETIYLFYEVLGLQLSKIPAAPENEDLIVLVANERTLLTKVFDFLTREDDIKTIKDNIAAQKTAVQSIKDKSPLPSGEARRMPRGMLIEDIASLDTDEKNIDSFFNLAEWELNNGNPSNAMEIYFVIENTFTNDEIKKLEKDGYSGNFLFNEGLARAYKMQKPWMPFYENYGLSQKHYNEALKLSEKKGGLYNNLIRVAEIYWNLSLLVMGIDLKLAENYRAKALELFPKRNHNTHHEYYRLAKKFTDEKKYGEAIKVYEKWLTQFPFSNPEIYKNCGEIYFNQKDYRNAFKWWLIGVKKMRPFYWDSGLIPKVINEIPYATLKEAKEIQNAIHGMAERYPAKTDKLASVAQLISKSNSGLLAFEIKVKQYEEQQDSSVSNLWNEGLVRYKHPLYACKLGNYNEAAKIYCGKMFDEEYPEFNKKGCAAQYIEPLVDKLDCNHLKLYINSLKKRADMYRNQIGKGADRVNNMVAAIDKRVAELEKRLIDTRKKKKNNIF